MHFETLKIILGSFDDVNGPDKRWRDVVAGLHWVVDNYPEVSFPFSDKHLMRVAGIKSGEIPVTEEELETGYFNAPHSLNHRVSSSSKALTEALDDIDITHHSNDHMKHRFHPKKEQVPIVYPDNHAPLRQGPSFTIFGSEKKGFEVLHSKKVEANKDIVDFYFYRIISPAPLPKCIKRKNKRDREAMEKELKRINKAAYQVKIAYEDDRVRFADGNF